MDIGHGEPGQAGQPGLLVDHDAEHQDDGQQQQRDDALVARLAYQNAVFIRPFRVVIPPAGQPATVKTAPVASTRRAGRPSPASQPSARRPRMTAAVLAALASAQFPAVTETVRQTGRRAGRCAGRGCGAARRRRAASGGRRCWRWPGRRRGWRSARRGRPWAPGAPVTSCTRTRQPPAWGLAGDGDVAAQADQDATAGTGRDTGGGAVRGPRLGGGAQVEPEPGGQGQGPAVQANLAPARYGLTVSSILGPFALI